MMPEMTEDGTIMGPNNLIKITQLKHITPREPSFFWNPYIPRGMITFLEGDPGVGKSWVGMKMASDASNGVPFPGQRGEVEPQKVLMLTGEEDLEYALASRLQKVQANTDRIFVSDSKFALNARGMSDLAFLMEKVDVSIVFLDPLQSFVPKEIDTNSVTDVYDMLGPLGRIARQTGVAVVIVRHLRKGGASNAKHAGIGSIGLTGIARSVLQVGVTKNGVHYLKHVKSNYSAPGETLSFTFGDDGFQWTGNLREGGEAAGVVTTRVRHEVVEFLFDVLRDGPKAVVDVMMEASQFGFKERTIASAKKEAGVRSVKKGNVWYWELADRMGIDAPLTIG